MVVFRDTLRKEISKCFFQSKLIAIDFFNKIEDIEAHLNMAGAVACSECRSIGAKNKSSDWIFLPMTISVIAPPS